MQMVLLLKSLWVGNNMRLTTVQLKSGAVTAIRLSSDEQSCGEAIDVFNEYDEKLTTIPASGYSITDEDLEVARVAVKAMS